MLGPVQTSNFACTESNANRQNLLFLLVNIRFAHMKVRCLNWALYKEFFSMAYRLSDKKLVRFAHSFYTIRASKETKES